MKEKIKLIIQFIFVSAVEFVVIVDQEHLVLANRRDGMRIIPSVIHAISNVTRDSHVHCVIVRTERMRTGKWCSVVSVEGIQSTLHKYVYQLRVVPSTS